MKTSNYTNVKALLKEISVSAYDYDSNYELKGWEYTIPKGMFAEIKDGKIIVKQKAINDEVVDTLIKYLSGIGVPYKPGLREKCIAFLNGLRGMKILPVFDSNKEIGDIFHIEKDGIKEAWVYMGPTIDK